MACQRRTICSAKFFTGLTCGVIMGFFMGTIHLAIMNSQFAYVTIGENPCLKDWRVLKLREDAVFRDSEVAKGRDQRPMVAKEKVGELEFAQPNNIYDYEAFDGGKESSEIDLLLHDSDIDKIYEIALSKLDQARKSERSNFLPRIKRLERIKPLSPKTHVTHDVHEDVEFRSEGRKLLYIGVMTTAKYVSTRGKAIMDTWGPKVPGKVELFVGEGAVLDELEKEKAMNVVRLKKVDDNVYPPQKKSFMMLKYMYDQYINGYEWFMRADDDAYVKADRLEKLLRNLNSSEPIFIGQTGLGNEEERGKLTLDHGENYCMGGPGMIFSREVIRRIAPHIGKCLQNMYTNHEDVEISRCVSKYANVYCVWSYEMRELFYEHYSKRLGYIDPYDGSYGNGIMEAITLHPNKKPKYQRVLHNYFLSQTIKAMQAKLSKLYRDVIAADAALQQEPDMEEFMLGSPLSLNRYRPVNGSKILPWSFFMERMYTPSNDMPRRGIPSYTHAAVKDIVMQVIRMMNSNANSRGRTISFKRVNYGYHRLNPLFGSEYILDMLLHYNRYRGKKVSLPVRRHAYLQQTFSRTEIHEDPGTDLAQLLRQYISRETSPGVLNSLVRNPVKAIFSFLGFGQRERTMRHHAKPLDFHGAREYDNYDVDSFPAEIDSRRLDSRFTDKNDSTTTVHPTVNLIVPLSGRFATFQRFMTNLERVALSHGEPVSLLLLLFVPKNANKRLDMRRTQELMKDYKSRYPTYSIRFLPVAGEFSRGLALEIGAAQFYGEALLFFCDVDVIFNSEFLRKCRANTIRGQSVYYPVLFSEFDPGFGRLLDGTLNERGNHYKITSDAGYWRGFGYGLLCVYQNDFMSTGGFDTSIRGWGLEDVDLFGKFVKRETEGDSENPTTSLVTPSTPMRVRDPDLIHVYHPSHCDPDLDSKQRTMCLASRGSGIMSVARLYRKWRETNGGDAFESVFDKDRPFGHQNPAENYQRKDKIFYGRVKNER